MVNGLATWGQAIATFFVGVVGFWFAHNYRRQLKVKLAERLLDAYSQLWEVTLVATQIAQTCSPGKSATTSLSP